MHFVPGVQIRVRQANGIIMRNSAILVDQIEQDIKAGADPFTAIVESAVSRFPPSRSPPPPASP